jgi:protein O-GlcNAc transferase
MSPSQTDRMAEALQAHQIGELAHALALCESLPQCKEAQFLKGLIYFEREQLPEAEKILTALVQEHPQWQDPRFALAQLHEALEKWEAAEEGYKCLLREGFEAQAILLALGQLYQRQGNHPLAFDTYSQLLKEAPHAEEGLLFMAHWHYQKNNYAHSQEYLNLFFKGLSNFSSPLASNGILLFTKILLTDAQKIEVPCIPPRRNPSESFWASLSRYGIASSPVVLQGFQTAIQKAIIEKNRHAIEFICQCWLNNPNPDTSRLWPEAFLLLGENYLQSEQFAKALNIYQLGLNAFSHSPQSHPPFHQGLAIVLSQLGQVSEAIPHYKEVLKRTPEDYRTYYNLGTAYWNTHQSSLAISSYEKALEINPCYEEALNGLAHIYFTLNEPQLAVDLLDKAYEYTQKPQYLIKKALTLPIIYPSSKAVDEWRTHQWDTLQTVNQLSFKLQDPLKDIGLTNFYLAYQGRNDKAHQQLLGGILAKALSATPYTARNPKNNLDSKTAQPIHHVKSQKPYRIGVISKFLYENHTITKLYQPLIDHLNRDQFQPIYFVIDSGQAQATPLKPSAGDPLIVLSPSDLEKNRLCVLEQDLDLLFYLDIGMDPTTYFMAFSRLAPVQCTTWGHPSTTGIPTLDYFITHPPLEASSDNDKRPEDCYSETPVLMSLLNTCYQKPEKPMKSFHRESFGFTTEQHLYICSQSLFKIHPDFDAVLEGILQQDTQGVVLFLEGPHPEWGKALQRRWSQTLPQVHQRIQILPRLSPSEFIGFQEMADVLLDSFPFAGGSTTMEAVALGIPLVTLENAFARGRVSSAVYHQMEVTDCIARSPQEYVEKALRLANDKIYRNKIQSKLLEAAPKIFNTKEAATELESLFKQMMDESKIPNNQTTQT